MNRWVYFESSYFDWEERREKEALEVLNRPVRTDPKKQNPKISLNFCKFLNTDTGLEESRIPANQDQPIMRVCLSSTSPKKIPPYIFVTKTVSFRHWNYLLSSGKSKYHFFNHLAYYTILTSGRTSLSDNPTFPRTWMDPLLETKAMTLHSTTFDSLPLKASPWYTCALIALIVLTLNCAIFRDTQLP